MLFSEGVYVSYILLYNKLLQNLAAYKSMHLSYYSFCGSGIRVQFRWVLWLRLSQGSSPLKVGLGRIPFVAMGLLAGFRSLWDVRLRPQFLMSYLLVKGSLGSLLHGPLTGVSYNMAACFFRESKSEGKREHE